LAARTIARKLAALGVPTPGEQKQNYIRQRSSGVWHHDAVIRILGQEAYAGVWHYGREIAHTGKLRPASEWVDIPVPAIIDRANWEKAEAAIPPRT